MTKYSYAAEYYQKHGNLYITSKYPPVDGQKRKTGLFEIKMESDTSYLTLPRNYNE